MKIACVQMTSVLDPAQNLPKLHEFFRQAKEARCEALFLPEVFFSKGDGSQATTHKVSCHNQHFASIQALVQRYGLYVLGGSVIFDDGGINRNRILNFAPDGQVINHYDKIHMFSCHLENSLTIDEAQFSAPGQTPVLLDLPPFKIGLSLCFDLRFPQLYQYYREQGAHVLSIASAFTVPTGSAHWHTLVRARAIETQSYVVASAQWGQHNAKSASYGHSLIVDPWGEILADAGEGEKLVFAELDLEQVRKVRAGVHMERYFSVS